MSFKILITFSEGVFSTNKIYYFFIPYRIEIQLEAAKAENDEDKIGDLTVQHKIHNARAKAARNLLTA